jgi:hypothetical protein
MDVAPASASPSSFTFAAAQREMRYAYLGGAPGMLVSAVVWLTAGLVNLRHTAQASVWALFIGGMLIHPLSIVLTRAAGRPGLHGKGNPMGTLVMETTVWMILCLPIVYGISLWRMDLFFPAMMLVIGGRFLTFATIYGAGVFRVCGALLAMAAYGVAANHLPAYMGAFTNSAIEAVFAAIIFARARQEPA